MAEIIKFDSLNIISIRIPLGLAQAAQLGNRGPLPQVSYVGRLRYVIAKDVTYTTSVAISEGRIDALGFTDVYLALQQYVANIIGQDSPTLGSIYFTPTAVTVRLGNQRNVVSSRPSLRQNNSKLVKVPFSKISPSFLDLMITFVRNIDTQARTQVGPAPF